MPIEVAIVEDDADLRERYAELIDSAADTRIAWAVATVREALRRLESPAPHVLLVDLGLPDGSGLTVIGSAKKRYPDCEVMVVSVFGDEENVVAAIEAGASGYLLKDALADSFLNTIRELRAGGSPISPSIARILLNRARAPHKAEDSRAALESELAERELEILGLVAKGFNFPEISRLLAISNNTVKTHIYRIYRKLSVHSRGEAVFEAKKLGLLDF
ncbi:MAG TPA: response regulator transcription factor [Steroidobacteraceae bacterium]|nr:response regulator transcription factor [Steroidobacteraceae bacterium]